MVGRQYIYLNKQNKPNTLIMLQKLENILQLILEYDIQICFIWIQQQQDENILEIVKRELEDKIIMLKNNFQEIQIDLKQKRSNFDIIIITSEKTESQAEKLLSQYEKIKHVIYFPVKDQNKSFSTDLFHNTVKDFRYVKDINKLLQIIKQYSNKNNKPRKQKLLPNFINVDKQANTFNNINRTMIAMLKHPFDKEMRKQLTYKFQHLLNKIMEVNNDFKNKSQLDIFLADLRNGLSKEDAIKWYTKDTAVYKTINNFLRSSRHPAQIFYIQPYFKDLFNAIKSEHNNKLLTKQPIKFICYRGGTMTDEQLEEFKGNKLGIVRNLAFLSTSLNEATAFQFIKNVKFEIIVDLLRINPQLTNGFAKISQFSFYSEQQILFNPLNSFRIIDVIKQKNITNQYFLIKLEYGPLAQQNHNNIQSANSMVLNFQRSLTKIFEQSQNKIRCQGDTLIPKYKLKGSLQYWLKHYNLICQDSISQPRKFQEQNNYFKCNNQIVNSLNMIGMAYQEQGQLQNALHYYQKTRNIILEQCKISKRNRQKFPRRQGSDSLNQKMEKLVKNYNKFKQICTLLYIKIHSSYVMRFKEIKNINVWKEQKIQVSKIFKNSREIITKLEQVIQNILYNQKKVCWLENYVQDISRFNQKLIIKQLPKKINETLYASLQYAKVLNNMANVYSQLKRYQQALEYYEQSKQIMVSQLKSIYAKQACSLKDSCQYQNQQKQQKQKQETKLYELNIKFYRSCSSPEICNYI